MTPRSAFGRGGSTTSGAAGAVEPGLVCDEDSCAGSEVGCKIGRAQARAHIEELLGRRVFLDLHVRTAKDWQSDPKMLGRLGF